jgi:hypothetical protein
MYLGGISFCGVDGGGCVGLWVDKREVEEGGGEGHYFEEFG